MSYNPISISPIDPNLITGPVRALGPVLETGTIIYDTPYGKFARFIYIGTSGDLSYSKWDGTIEILPNIVAGIWHPICSIKINSVGTTIAANQLRWGS